MPEQTDDAPARNQSRLPAEAALRELEQLAAAWVERQRQRLLQIEGAC